MRALRAEGGGSITGGLCNLLSRYFSGRISALGNTLDWKINKVLPILGLHFPIGRQEIHKSSHIIHLNIILKIRQRKA